MTRAAPPLAGITVVALEQAVAAPFATRQLADLGARVIKIERPDGGDFARGYDTSVRGLSAHFVWLNRSKESLTLDLKHAAAGGILARLLARADVFVQNLAPGAADRLGLSASALRARDPRLVVCNVSGYGAAGPYAAKKAYDLLVQSETGVVSITGTGDVPCRVGISIADIAAGMYAYSAVLTALFRRQATGTGTTIDLSLFDALVEWMGFPLYHAAYTGNELRRSGPNHISIAPYGPFRTSAGHVYLAIQNTREWIRFCSDVLGRPGMHDEERFRTNEQRVRHRDALREVIEEVFGTLPLDEVAARLERAQIAYARMNSVREVLEHPQLTTRGRWADIGSEAGPLRAVKPPVTIEGVEAVMGDVPALGQHTGAILQELGFDDGTVATWRKEAVI
ncbi:MAG: carnitine dehydratase [Acidobacteria bacterium RIFCSPLOWO2_02_FULL_68_18]|nr:MAG: carnitine dehydratase [Acidobacteria bacterium RIFCSPLOWO2_02_FULL_68_18]OFW49674.1 MAG: carnitine dehydratase [Acidobacteria bacterium RIFCSPLOWO2_12_FULL_68_19]